MTQTQSAGEFAQSARMVLQQLNWPGATLAPSGGGEWAIVAGKGRRHGGQAVADALVCKLVGRGWLIKEPTGCYRLSVAGGRWMAGAGANAAENFADQHRLVRRPDQGSARDARRGPAGPVLNEAESPLGWLRSRRDKHGEPLISEAQHEAGERLRVDFTLAQLSPRVTLSWDACAAPRSQGRSGRRPDSLEVNERALAAKQRFMRALDAVGPELSRILVDVCCLWRGLEAAERGLGWPQRSGKLVLQIALTQLARHYGLLRAETDSRRPASVRHWGVDDYRPEVGYMPQAGDGDGDQT